MLWDYGVSNLAALGPMCRNEISALLDTDINETVVTVNKAMGKNKDNAWIIKDPKTFSSNRDIDYPEFVIDKMKGRKGNIVKLNPEQISMRFNRLLKKINLELFRFHDLHHYCASIFHAKNIPDQYIIARGGWASDAVLKKVYRHTISDEEAKITKK